MSRAIVLGFRFLLLLLLIFLLSCQSIYYSAMEKIGREKRDILVSRVKEGRKDQEEAKKQFQSALEAFQSLTGFEGGDLEKTYRKLNEEYQDSEKRAEDVRKQIASIERVAGDLFQEWEAEIRSMENPDLKRRSRAMLEDTRRRSTQLIARMKEAEARMRPVLKVFHDQVLFLKHNLNAQAIRSLKNTVVKIDADVAALVKDIERSVAEADAFIAAMSSE